MTVRSAPEPQVTPLRVHIGTLAVPAASHVQGVRIASALVRELERALSAPGAIDSLQIAAASGAASSPSVLRGGSIAWRVEAGPERIGRSVATRISESLTSLARAPDPGARR
jgi:hypothetical protein